ncbi:MAG: 16S rRNA (guanine(527)-N(7))-methyltransferase RsmG [Gammaproteobacteria bacterium]|nr:16S rRNA (guanine(527)-N(7))-methyltransferase RsmG [Gammaproteobacteria bacterium]MDH3858488.1 16S rRNA (guanine(527)-N(7))-methyltransferase RsmG [Gammaproteobacteria bacterium]
MNLAGELRAGTEALGITLQQSQHDQLLEYLRLLEKWNQVYNLTSIRGLPRMLSYHLLDSLSVLPLLVNGRKAIDVGSGAGLPGIPLAIAMPDVIWILLDSNARKTRFIRQAIAHCGLKNAQVVQSRVQDYHAPDALDFIVSRAYAPLAEFCDSVAHLMEPKTRLITMKTGLRQEEVKQLDTGRFAYKEKTIKVPGIVESRSLVTISAL